MVVCNPAGAVRVESPSMFHNAGLAQVGDIDGSKVSVWTGGAAPKQAAIAATPSPAALGALGEIRK